MLTVIATCKKDYTAAVRLAGWIAELGNVKDHQCLVVTASGVHAGTDLMEPLKSAFRNVALMPLTDKEPPLNPHREGLPHAAAANLMFRRAAKEIFEQGNKIMSRRRAVAMADPRTKLRNSVIGHNQLHPKNQRAVPPPVPVEEPEPFLWLEPDAVPLHPDWLNVLAASYKALPRGKRFMGAVVHRPPQRPFMSGVAVYPWDAATIESLVTCEFAAWDVNSAAEVMPLMQPTELIQHQWQAPEDWTDLSRLKPAVVFHSCKGDSLINALRIARMTAHPAATGKCWCEKCHDARGEPIRRMIVCPTCGNKRCPKATDHNNECTNSNETGQPGSSWENVRPLTPTIPEPTPTPEPACDPPLAQVDDEIKKIEDEIVDFCAKKNAEVESAKMADKLRRDLDLRRAGTPAPYTESTEAITAQLCEHLRLIFDAGDDEKRAVAKHLKDNGLVLPAKKTRKKNHQ